MFTQIGEIAEAIPVLTPETKCETVNRYFKSNPNLEGVAVLGEEGTPSLMMRARFFQEIATRYGYNLYMGRPVELVMNTRPLVVDYKEQITKVSVKAMNRSEEELYDLVLVTLEGQLYGAVSIRRLLLAVADIRAEMAIFMNPLTGLPGNRIIDDRLHQSVQLAQYSVLYIDLDHGTTRHIPLVSISIAVVTNHGRNYESIDHIVSEATRVKKRCKSVNGSIICTDEDTVG
jgi:hypothetical protein